MAIQWYPGHMTAAKKKAEEAMEINDVIIEVLDARIPGSSINPMIESLRLTRQRPHLKVLNKADLADSKITKQWIEFFNSKPNTTAISLSAKKISEVKKILSHSKKLAPHRGTSVKPLRMLIMGVPNVGKSTIINALKNKKIAKVGNIPAVTKTLQRIDINNNIILTDSPGMMWPKIANDLDGFFLAASHSIGINAYDEIETALVLSETLKTLYPKLLIDFYGFEDPLPVDEKFLEHIAQKRKFIMKGNKLNLLKAAISFINDYRDGVIGKISLETPSSRELMLKKLL